MAADAIAHGDKGAGGLANLGCAFGFEIGRIAPGAERIGGRCQPADGAYLIFHKNRRHAKQQQTGADHPHHKDISRGAEQSFVGHHHAQYIAAQLDFDRHVAIIALGIDAERFSDLAGQRSGQHLNHATVIDVGWVDHIVRAHIKYQIHFGAGLAKHPLVHGRVLVFAHGFDNVRNIARHAQRQTPPNLVPVVFKKYCRRHHLQQHQRHDNDQHGSTEQAFG